MGGGSTNLRKAQEPFASPGQGGPQKCCSHLRNGAFPCLLGKGESLLVFGETCPGSYSSWQAGRALSFAGVCLSLELDTSLKGDKLLLQGVVT